MTIIKVRSDVIVAGDRFCNDREYVDVMPTGQPQVYMIGRKRPGCVQDEFNPDEAYDLVRDFRFYVDGCKRRLRSCISSFWLRTRNDPMDYADSAAVKSVLSLLSDLNAANGCELYRVLGLFTKHDVKR
ncbi:hypothetical protein HY490_03130 [Candidatus Woesearchaeota archaeon]|nr:hypothetical protein [Candidatus Woesearchaeota archaeon]